jgi:membrane associated rhomboid family serine protease
MFFPIGDDNPTSRTPVVTYGLIGLNALVFIVANVLSSRSFGSLPPRVALDYGLVPNDAVWYTFFTSMFLHGNILHVIGNMVFLWVAGDNVEDKIGHLPFLAFYLAGGLFADGAYLLFTRGGGHIPLVGASGAIAAVLGAYMVFFPRARIRIFYWIFTDLYHTGISVAPVPDQLLYNTIYQERYMGLPNDNKEGFKNGSPIYFAHQLKGNLLLVHGTGDDNVHYQGSERLIHKLITHNKHFTMMAYPNRSHSIREGKNTTLHLYHLMTRYLNDNLKKKIRNRS